MKKKLSSKASRLIRTFRVWTVEYDHIGAHDPAEWEEIEKWYKESRKNLREYIRDLENWKSPLGGG